jgi:enoyl-CoA hydratase/carnithine racemase
MGAELMSDGSISVEKRGHILLMGINRPEKYNAFSLAMFADLARAYALLDQDDELRCGVLFGHGKHFTAGLDLAQWSEKFAAGVFSTPPADGIDPLGLVGEPCRKPVVSAVHGICFTIGIELMLATDLRVAASDTRFGQIEIKRGIYPVGGATLRMPVEAGWSNAMRYLLTGDEFNAEDARRMGLIQEITAPGEQLEKAVALAEQIAKQAPLGVYATLKSARLVRAAQEQAAIRDLLPVLVTLMQSEDAAEGVRSFVERREAQFKGR